MEETTRTMHHKLLLYCADGTIQDPAVLANDLTPTVALWDAGTVEVCETRLLSLEALFAAQVNGPFLFPMDRTILFDYSSYAPLWYTDREQLDLMKKYKARILDARPRFLRET